MQDKELVVEKVDTKENVADLMTKSLTAEVASYFMEKLGIYRADGRSNLTLEIALMTSGEAILKTAQFLKRHWSVGSDRIPDLPLRELGGDLPSLLWL